MPTPTQSLPTPSDQRISLLDALRGFAVLGILLANLPFMGMAGTMTDSAAPHIGGDRWLDHASYQFVFLFADTKFLALFSLLFGASLALIHQRAERSGAPFVRPYLRRLFVLFLFGVGHIALLWFGDILVFYSLIGFLAMWFRRCQVRTLLVWASALFLLNAALWAAISVIDPSEFILPAVGPSGHLLSIDETLAQQAAYHRAVFTSGSFGEMVQTRLNVYSDSGVFMLLFLGMRTLALILVGMAIIQSNLLTHLTSRRRLLIQTSILSFAIGLALHLLAQGIGQAAPPHSTGVVFNPIFYAAGLVMALAYAATFTLWMHSNLWHGLRSRFVAVGRMALTNYLIHSLITAFVFHFLGCYDQWRRPGLLVMALAIYSVQLWASPIWLRHWNFGPFEWLWRSLTYGRWVPMRRG